MNNTLLFYYNFFCEVCWYLQLTDSVYAKIEYVIQKLEYLGYISTSTDASSTQVKLIV